MKRRGSAVGGLDSATVLALARAQGFECHALSVDTASAITPNSRGTAVARELGAQELRVINIDLTASAARR